MTTSKTREAFEAAMLPRWQNMDKPPRIINDGAPSAGEYAHFNWQECWELWQASRDAALEDAALVPEDPGAGGEGRADVKRDALNCVVRPYVETVDFGRTMRIGFAGAGYRRPITIILPPEIPAAQAVAELRDLADRVEHCFTKDMQPTESSRKVAGPRNAMSPEYGR